MTKKAKSDPVRFQTYGRLSKPARQVQKKEDRYDDGPPLPGFGSGALLSSLAQGPVVQQSGDEAVQMSGGSDAVKAAAAQGISGSGGSLPHLDRIQQSFGHHDVGSVDAHVGGKAAAANEAMGSAAYATGSSIGFKSSPDLHTAAHEAAHVIQQRQGVSLKDGVGQVGDKYEKHADKVADTVVSGKSAASLLDAGPSGGSSVQRLADGHDTGVQARTETDTVQSTTDPDTAESSAVGTHLGVVMPAGDQAVMMVVQTQPDSGSSGGGGGSGSSGGGGGSGGSGSSGGGGGGGGSGSSAGGGEAEVRYRWVQGGTSEAPAWYLVPDPDGEVALGKVQRTTIDENVDLEARVRGFELTMGQHAAGHGAATGAARAMANRVVEVVDAFIEVLRSATEEVTNVDELFSNTLGEGDPIWAGAVGTNENVIRQAANGNIREQLTLAVNFVYNFGRAFIEGQRTADMTTYLEQLRTQSEGLADRLAVMDESDNRLVQNADPRVSGLIEEQGRMRDNDTASRRTERTLGEMRAEMRAEHPLSWRELTAMGINRDEQGRFVAREEIQDRQLTWNEGIRVFVIEDHDDFVEQLREAAVPLGAGTSGTTARIMYAAEMLGMPDPIATRAACIGYLIPIRAHTLWEVLRGATAGGAPNPEPHLGAFREIEPFGPSSAIFPDEEFWQIVDDTVRRVTGG